MLGREDGSRRWIALRLDAGEIEWGEVTELLWQLHADCTQSDPAEKLEPPIPPGVLGAIGLQT
jgi:hypothetical protein